MAENLMIKVVDRGGDGRSVMTYKLWTYNGLYRCQSLMSISAWFDVSCLIGRILKRGKDNSVQLSNECMKAKVVERVGDSVLVPEAHKVIFGLVDSINQAIEVVLSEVKCGICQLLYVPH